MNVKGGCMRKKGVSILLAVVLLGLFCIYRGMPPSRKVIKELRKIRAESALLGDKKVSSSVENLLRRLIPKDPVTDKKKIRVGSNNDGGYVMLDSFEGTQAVYGIGIGDNFEWEEDIANRISDVDVFMYDHTIKSPALRNKQLKFYRVGICGENTRGDDLKTFEEILKKDDNFGKENIILKIDVEGAEWDAFGTVSEDVMEKFSQIVIELHDVNKLDSKHYDEMIKALDKISITHEVIHIHANNHGNYSILGGIPVPQTLEVTYLRKKGNEFKKNTQIYPMKGLDQPNNSQKAEFVLAFVNNEFIN
jgi:hypothetical protein